MQQMEDLGKKIVAMHSCFIVESWLGLIAHSLGCDKLLDIVDDVNVKSRQLLKVDHLLYSSLVWKKFKCR